MPPDDAVHVGGRKVFNPFHLKRGVGLTAALSASASLEDFFGSPIPDNIAAVLINNLTADTININDFDGVDADEDNETMAGNDSQFFEGSKEELDEMEIFATVSHNVSIRQFVTR